MDGLSDQLLNDSIKFTLTLSELRISSSTWLYLLCMFWGEVSLNAARDSEWLTAANSSLLGILKHLETKITISILLSEWQCSPHGNGFCWVTGNKKKNTLPSVQSNTGFLPPNSTLGNKNICWEAFTCRGSTRVTMRSALMGERWEYVCG